MKTNRQILIAPIILLTFGTGFFSSARSQETKSRTHQKAPAVAQKADAFLGEYYSNAAYLEHRIKITKEGDYYRLSAKPYNMYKFVKKSKCVLENENLGTITLGHLVFEGNKEESQIVLRFSFCYQWGLLFKRPEPKS